MFWNLSGEAAGSGGGEAEDPCANHTDSWAWVYTLQPAYMSAICLCGVAGNLFVLLVLGLQRQHGTVADIYLGNLAVADLLMVSCLPFWVATVVRRFHWRFGEAMCRLVSGVIGANYYCSALFLAVVSADRYLALTRPWTHGRGRRAAWAHGICGAVWTLGVVLSLPGLVFRSVRFYPDLGVDVCYVDYPHAGWRLRYNLTVHVVGFLVPVPVASFCSYRVVRVLRSSRAVREGCGGSSGVAGRERRERKAAHLVLVVLGAFVVCWLPYQVLMLLDTLYYYQDLPGCTWAYVLDIGIQLATYLGYSNSSLNPFLYVIVGTHFRQRARAVFRSALCGRKGRNSSATNAKLNLTSK